MPKTDYIPRLLKLFRQHGYDGATLSKISQATGLGKASLYHHFPRGKDEMVQVVLAYLEESINQSLIECLEQEGSTFQRLQVMCARISSLYEGGEESCLFAILLSGSARDIFHAKVSELMSRLIEAIAKILREAGLPKTEARERAEDAVLSIQGALIVSQSLNNISPFTRIIHQLPEKLCQGLPR